MIRATEHLGQCEDPDCLFQSDGQCMNGMRHVGCDKELSIEGKQRLEEAVILRTMADTSYNKEITDIANRKQNKVFNFVLNGHEYTASDSARSQNTCPHCDYRNPSGVMFQAHSPGVTFIGVKTFGDHIARCFMCEKCNNHFFYHTG